MRNPYDAKANPKERHDYAAGFTKAQCDMAAGLKANGSRRWSQAYRWGYSDGFSNGEKTW